MKGVCTTPLTGFWSLGAFHIVFCHVALGGRHRAAEGLGAGRARGFRLPDG